MAKTKVSRMAWVLAVILAGVLVGGIGLLGLRLRPYWLARYRGDRADLHGASLPFVPLEGVSLNNANLTKADLFRANLRGSDLSGANFAAADLSCADLTGALLTCADLRGADLGDLLARRADLRGIRYDRATRWPEGVNPDGWCLSRCAEGMGRKEGSEEASLV